MATRGAPSVRPLTFAGSPRQRPLQSQQTAMGTQFGRRTATLALFSMRHEAPGSIADLVRGVTVREFQAAPSAIGDAVQRCGIVSHFTVLRKVSPYSQTNCQAFCQSL